MAACLLWNNSQQTGCLDLDLTDGTIGRYSFESNPQWMPRKLLTFGRFADYWLASKATNHDHISVWAYVDRRWQELTEVPLPIDDNTMLQVWISNYLFKLIFLGDLTCADASITGEHWDSDLWQQPINTKIEVKEPSKEIPQVPQTLDRRIQDWLDWLAIYFKKNGIAGIVAIALTLSIVVTAWTIQTKPEVLQQLFQKTEDKNK